MSLIQSIFERVDEWRQINVKVSLFERLSAYRNAETVTYNDLIERLLDEHEGKTPAQRRA